MADIPGAGELGGLVGAEFGGIVGEGAAAEVPSLKSALAEKGPGRAAEKSISETLFESKEKAADKKAGLGISIPRDRIKTAWDNPNPYAFQTYEEQGASIAGNLYRRMNSDEYKRMTTDQKINDRVQFFNKYVAPINAKAGKEVSLQDWLAGTINTDNLNPMQFGSTEGQADIDIAAQSAMHSIAGQVMSGAKLGKLFLAAHYGLQNYFNVNMAGPYTKNISFYDAVKDGYQKAQGGILDTILRNGTNAQMSSNMWLQEHPRDGYLATAAKWGGDLAATAPLYEALSAVGIGGRIVGGVEKGLAAGLGEGVAKKGIVDLAESLSRRAAVGEAGMFDIPVGQAVTGRIGKTLTEKLAGTEAGKFVEERLNNGFVAAVGNMLNEGRLKPETKDIGVGVVGAGVGWGLEAGMKGAGKVLGSIAKKFGSKTTPDVADKATATATEWLRKVYVTPEPEKPYGLLPATAGEAGDVPGTRYYGAPRRGTQPYRAGAVEERQTVPWGEESRGETGMTAAPGRATGTRPAEPEVIPPYRAPEGPDYRQPGKTIRGRFEEVQPAELMARGRATGPPPKPEPEVIPPPRKPEGPQPRKPGKTIEGVWQEVPRMDSLAIQKWNANLHVVGGEPFSENVIASAFSDLAKGPQGFHDLLERFKNDPVALKYHLGEMLAQHSIALNDFGKPFHHLSSAEQNEVLRTRLYHAKMSQARLPALVPELHEQEVRQRVKAQEQRDPEFRALKNQIEQSTPGTDVAGIAARNENRSIREQTGMDDPMQAAINSNVKPEIPGQVSEAEFSADRSEQIRKGNEKNKNTDWTKVAKAENTAEFMKMLDDYDGNKLQWDKKFHRLLYNFAGRANLPELMQRRLVRELEKNAALDLPKAYRKHIPDWTSKDYGRMADRLLLNINLLAREGRLGDRLFGSTEVLMQPSKWQTQLMTDIDLKEMMYLRETFKNHPDSLRVMSGTLAMLQSHRTYSFVTPEEWMNHDRIIQNVLYGITKEDRELRSKMTAEFVSLPKEQKEEYLRRAYVGAEKEGPLPNLRRKATLPPGTYEPEPQSVPQ